MLMQSIHYGQTQIVLLKSSEAQRQLGVQVTEGQTSDLGTLTLP